MTKDEVAALADQLKATTIAALDGIITSLQNARMSFSTSMNSLVTEITNIEEPDQTEPPPPAPPPDDVPPPPPGPGPTVNVSSLTELSNAMRTAGDGTVIVLAPGTYNGEIVAPVRSLATGITVRGGGQAPGDTKIIPGKEKSGLVVLPGTNGWKFENLSIEAQNGYQNTSLVVIGSHTEVLASNQPNNITLRDMIVLAHPQQGGRRGVTLHGRNTVIDNCTIRGFKADTEAQAIACWNGPGPYTIRDCSLSAAGEVIIFGGAAGLIGQNPKDILIENCILEKTPDMLEKKPTGGDRWMRKNILELKRAENVTVRGCTFRNSYHGAQQGYTIVLTVRTEHGQNPFGAVKNVLIENCQIVNCAAGFNISGYDNNGNGNPGVLDGVTVRNCRIDINRNMGGAARTFQILSGAKNITIEGCTVTGTPSMAMIFDSGPPSPPSDPGWVADNPIVGLTVRNNSLKGPVLGRGVSWTQAIQKFVRNLVWTGNTWSDGTNPPSGFPPSV